MFLTICSQIHIYQFLMQVFFKEIRMAVHTFDILAVLNVLKVFAVCLLYLYIYHDID